MQAKMTVRPTRSCDHLTCFSLGTFWSSPLLTSRGAPSQPRAGLHPCLPTNHNITPWYDLGKYIRPRDSWTLRLHESARERKAEAVSLRRAAVGGPVR